MQKKANSMQETFELCFSSRFPRGAFFGRVKDSNPCFSYQTDIHKTTIVNLVDEVKQALFNPLKQH